MTVIGEDVPGRRGWSIGTVLISASERRSPLTHVETGNSYWVWGQTPEDRIQAAQELIDGVYQKHWDLMADVIEEGDRRGPNVRSLHDDRFDAP